MGMTNVILPVKYATLFFVSVLSSALFLMGMVHPLAVRGQDILADSGGKTQYYFLELSGMVYQEKFFGVRGLLSIAYTQASSLNPYEIVIGGFPQENSRNSFYFTTEESFMTVFSNEITCDIKNTWLKENGNHFFYLSPTLLANKGPWLTQHEKERRRLAEKGALPIKVFAKAGKLTLLRNGNQISGSVWLKGYDNIQRSYVMYSASFQGRRSLAMEASKQARK